MFYVALRYNTVEVIKIAVDKLFNKERVAWYWNLRDGGMGFKRQQGVSLLRLQHDLSLYSRKQIMRTT